jgi:restriction endonuclease S subunit
VDLKYLYFLWLFQGLLKTKKTATAVTLKTDSLGFLRNFAIPVSNLETQRAIFAEIEVEQVLGYAHRELIRRMEAMIKTAVERAWGASD